MQIPKIIAVVIVFFISAYVQAQTANPPGVVTGVFGPTLLPGTVQPPAGAPVPPAQVITNENNQTGVNWQTGAPITPAAVPGTAANGSTTMTCTSTTPGGCANIGGGYGSPCFTALQTMLASCNNGNNISQAAGMIQGATSGLGANNTAQQVAQAACNAEELQGGAALAGVAMVAASCRSAYGPCQQACAGTPQAQSCTTTYHNFITAAAMNAGVSVAVLGQAIDCNTGVSDTTPPGPLANAAQDPITDPNATGFSGYPTTASSPVAADQPSTGDGGMPLANGAYPGGAAGPATAAQQASGNLNTGVDHGVGGSNGTGWPGGTGNAGWPGAATTEKGLDLSQFLPRGKEDPSRGLAGETQKEISGANDLSNFQKITRMMNKKRTALKSGDGA